jgi:release factor glutamine methyltransferase
MYRTRHSHVFSTFLFTKNAVDIWPLPLTLVHDSFENQKRMQQDPIPDHPQILGTAKLAFSSLFPKYPRRECENLIRNLVIHITNRSWTQILMHPTDAFSEQEYQQWCTSLARLQAMEPLQYITGVAWFDDLPIAVGPGVLIPRPETEELVAWVAESPLPPAARILDLCSGIGCIAVALARRFPQAEVHALEFSPDALTFTWRNVEMHAPGVQVIAADIFQDVALPTPLQVITCNPPYIPTHERAEMDAHVTDFEPGLALFVPDDDPLRYYIRTAAIGRSHLAPGGKLYFEIHASQGQAVLDLLRAQGYQDLQLRPDMQGHDRMVRATWPG